jgi:hypothetical protein
MGDIQSPPAYSVAIINTVGNYYVTQCLGVIKHVRNEFYKAKFPAFQNFIQIIPCIRQCYLDSGFGYSTFLKFYLCSPFFFFLIIPYAFFRLRIIPFYLWILLDIW